MFRQIETHRGSLVNDQLRIRAVDEPGAGGACHHYRIEYSDQWTWDTHFQEGYVHEVGINGITIEALLAIVRDRLAGFQSGPYACEDNEDALGAIVDAMAALARRTRNRQERGVEDTSVV